MDPQAAYEKAKRDAAKKYADATKAVQAIAGALEKKAAEIIKSRNADGIPESPLANMANVYLRGDRGSAAILQGAIDTLTVKAKAAKSFTDDDKEFMTELFDSMWYGGKYKGFYEAAILASHYVNGGGSTLFISAGVYVDSVIVRDTMRAMRAYLSGTDYRSQDMITLKSSDPGFLASPFAKALGRGGRKLNSQGHILPGGTLLTEQDNARLKNADHRFYLQVTARKDGFMSTVNWLAQGAENTYRSSFSGLVEDLTGVSDATVNIDDLKRLDDEYSLRWRVDSYYDFEAFPTTYYTPLPLRDGLVLKLPDGLSQYLTKVGVAKEFDYYSEW